jgi:hypothetical protein
MEGKARRSSKAIKRLTQGYCTALIPFWNSLDEEPSQRQILALESIPFFLPVKDSHVKKTYTEDDNGGPD